MTPMERALLDQLAAFHAESFAWALGCCRRDRHAAEEVLQAVYLKVAEGRARFDGHSSLRTWLFAVIRRTAADHRRRAVLRWLRLAPLEQGLEVQGRGAEEDVEAADRRERLVRGLERLSQRQREVLILVFYHEMTIEEAAGVMGIGLGSARTHYQRGKQRLRELLGRGVRDAG